MTSDFQKSEPASDEDNEQDPRSGEQRAYKHEGLRTVRDMYARSIRESLTKLEGFLADFLEKYTDGSVSPDDFSIKYRLWDWNKAFGRGEVPAAFRGRSLEGDASKAGGLIYYGMLVSSLRSTIEHGLGLGLPGANRLTDAQQAELLTSS